MDGRRGLSRLTCRNGNLIQSFNHVAGREQAADCRLLVRIDDDATSPAQASASHSRQFRARGGSEGNIKGVELEQLAIGQMGVQEFSIDRQISNRRAFDGNTASSQICRLGYRQLRTVLREQGHGVAIVANEQSLGRAMVGAAQHGHSLAADLIAVADRAITYQSLGDASIMRFLPHSGSMICDALGKQY